MNFIAPVALGLGCTIVGNLLGSNTIEDVAWSAGLSLIGSALRIPIGGTSR